MARAKNLLILCSDEHARSALGCYGHPVVQTPNLDALAARGVRFDRAYTPSPICIPARASLATGLHVHETGCWSSAEPYEGQHQSWGHRVQAVGKRCVSIGKLHYRAQGGDHGFDQEIAPMYLANGGLGWPEGLLRGIKTGFDDAGDLAAEVGRGSTSYTDYDTRITRAACDWLKREGGGDPFALFVSFVSPHFPLKAPDAFYDLYADHHPDGAARDVPDHPAVRRAAEFWSYDRHFTPETRIEAIRGYYGLCSFLDHNVGQVLAALQASGAADDTVVLYISDHGEMLGEKGFWAKSVMYEASVGVPMIMAGPGIALGANPTPVSLTDVSATVADVMGTENPHEGGAPWQSRSLLSLAAAPETGRAILSEYHDGGSDCGYFMLRKDRFKLVVYTGGHPPQLFNMDDDPGEVHDLASDPGHAPVLAALRTELEAMVDTEAAADRAFADQAALIARLGGADRICALPSFNATPVGSGLSD